MLVFVLVSVFLCPFMFCNHLDEDERAGYFVLIVLCLATVNVLWLFLIEPFVCLQCVIVVFPGHTHLFLYGLKRCSLNCRPKVKIMSLQMLSANM